MTTFNDMVYVLGGVPILPGNTVTGNVFFVGNAVTGATDAPNYGKSPAAPFATADYAVGQCTEGNGDIIYGLPGHNEALTAGTSFLMDKAGVSFIGLGRGMNRPIFDYDNTAGTIEMDAANTRLSNVILRASVSATVVGINVDADDVTIDNCYFTWEATGDEFITCIDVDAFDRCTISDNVFETEEGAAQSTEAIRLDDTNDTAIQRNVFRGTWSDAAILNEGALCARLLILDNIVYNSDTSVYNGIDVGTLSTTGIVRGNTITALYATAVAKVYRDGDLMSADNYFANAVSERASAAFPATSSA